MAKNSILHKQPKSRVKHLFIIYAEWEEVLSNQLQLAKLVSLLLLVKCIYLPLLNLSLCINNDVSILMVITLANSVAMFV